MSGPGPSLGAYQKVLGLKRNPFKRLYLTSPEEASLLFVRQEQDRLLMAMSAEAISGSGSAFVAITGPKGSGRTHRLMVMQDIVSKAKGEVLHFDAGMMSGPDVMDRLIGAAAQRTKSISRAIKKGLLGYAETIPDEELDEIRTSPVKVGEVVLRALTKLTPSALLLDEVYSALGLDEYWRFIFFESLREIVSSMPEGVVVAIAISDECFAVLDRNFPALTSRLHHRFRIPPLNNDQALELVEKRTKPYLAGDTRRLPVDEEVVKRANEAVEGNPSRLLKLLTRAVDLAVLLTKRKVDLGVLENLLSIRRPRMEYVNSAPEKFRRELYALIEEFDGGPVELGALANEVEIIPDEETARLDAMVIAGLIERDGAGRYFIPPDKLAQALEEKPRKRRRKLRDARRKGRKIRT